MADEPRTHEVEPFDFRSVKCVWADEVEALEIELGKMAYVFQGGSIVSARPIAAVYPCASPPATSPDGDWTHDPERQAWTSARLKATILTRGDLWWVRLGDEWLKADDGGVREFVSAHAAKRTVAEIRAKEAA